METETSWKLFATLAEAAGGRREVVVAVEGADPTVGDALDALLASHPDLEPLVVEDGDLRPQVNLLVNGEHAGLDDPVSADDEFALFPPVSGGEAGR
jgi:molybdopterin synthase sulfur carrier subunit